MLVMTFSFVGLIIIFKFAHGRYPLIGLQCKGLLRKEIAQPSAFYTTGLTIEFGLVPDVPEEYCAWTIHDNFNHINKLD